MWVYLKHKDSAWYEVGFFLPAPQSEWCLIKQVRKEIDAQKLVNYLNGGTG